MKKLLSMIMVFTIILSTATVAFAAPTSLSEYQKSLTGIERANHPEAALVEKGEAPYTFSKTKLKYDYNIYVEGKGYMDFGKDKPFLDKNGALYLPIKHMAYLGDTVCFWEEETIGKYYTEENSPYKNYTTDDGVSENAITYETKNEFKLKINSSVRTQESRQLLTEYGIEFLENGGKFSEQQREVFGYNPYSPGRIINETDYGYKVLSKNSTSYWERTLLNSMVGNDMLVNRAEKTLYYGSEEFITKKLQEMEKTNKIDEHFNNGGSYMDTIDDLFKGIGEYKPVK